jgi:hypothetical protein
MQEEIDIDGRFIDELEKELLNKEFISKQEKYNKNLVEAKLNVIESLRR